jgi:glycosyltransferase involved in cell wall biosynthesis
MPVITLPEAINPWLRKTYSDYFNPFAVADFKKHLLRFNPDVVHVHSLYGLSTALVKTASRVCPVVVTLHDAWFAFADSGLLTPKFNLANTYLKAPHGYIHRIINRHHLHTAALVSPSQWLIKFFEGAGFNTPFHIPNGLSPEGRFTRYEKTVLWVGSVTTFKGLPRIIGRVAPLLARLGWRFVIIGDGPHKRMLKREHPEVEFVGYQDPTPYYEAASILIVSSLGKENFPTVILEAMRHGLCVVGHTIGGIPELVSHDYTGLLYQSEEMLDEYLVDLTLNEEKVRRLGASGHEQFMDKYLLEVCTKRYLDLYESLTPDRKAAKHFVALQNFGL